jgi:hypothetical protein
LRVDVTRHRVGSRAHGSKAIGRAAEALRRGSAGSLLVPSVVVVAAVVAMLATCAAVFMVNDDAAMSSFASGAYTGEPARHLVFIGAAPGFLLASLYRLTPAVPWFGLTMLATQTASIAILVTLTWARRRSLGTFSCVLVSAVVCTYLPVFTLTPTFTMTAMLLAVTAVVSLAATFDSRRSRGWIVLAIVCLLSGATVRWDAAVGVLVTLFPLLVAFGWRARPNWRRALAVAAVLGMLLGSLHLFDLTWSKRRGWAAFASYNAVRGRLHGTSQLTNAVDAVDEPAMAALLHDLHWTADDLTLFAFWFFDDPTVYSKAHLERLLEVTQRSAFRAPLRASLHTVFDGRADLVGLVLVSAVVSVAAAARRRRRFAWVVAQLGWALAVDIFVASRLRFPDRVAIPSMFAVTVSTVLCFGLVVPDTETSTEPRGAAKGARAGRRARILLAGSLAIVAVPAFAARGPAALSRKNRAAARRLSNQIEVLEHVDPRGRFVAFGAAVDLASVDPLDARSGQRTARVLEMGWPTFSPLFVQRKHRFGISGDLLTALVRQEDLYLIAPPSVMPILQRTYLRRNRLHMTAHPKADLGNGESVFQLRQATTAELDAAG